MKCFSIVYKNKFLFSFFLLVVTFQVSGQNSKLLNNNSLNSSDNSSLATFTDSQIQYIKNSYFSKIEVPNELINGKEYESYYWRSTSKPLLFPGKKRTATLYTRTRQYKNISLEYDTFHDEVIYTDKSRTLDDRFPQIALNKDITYGFNLYFDDDSMIFRYLRLPEFGKLNLKEGFYEIAYQGNSEFFIKHKSSFYQKDGLNEYKYYHEYYISTGGKFFKIKNRISLLKLFGDKASIMKKFMHESRIRMRQAGRNQLADILKHYDNLSISSRRL